MFSKTTYLENITNPVLFDEMGGFKNQRPSYHRVKPR